MTPLKTNKKELRTFGLTMAGAFAVLGAFLWWKSGFAALPIYASWPFYASGAFTLIALAAPTILAPFEWIWMRLAHAMGFVMTRVILSITFYLVITPTGLVFWLIRRDLLGKRFKPGAKSYWIPTERDGPWTRPDKPY